MGRNEFSKTSLHNHFGGKHADYTLNDSDPHSFDTRFAIKKIDEAVSLGYQVLAVTNSNHLWENAYDDLVKYVKTKNYDISLIPGVEFNIVDDLHKNAVDRKYLHLIFLVSPKADLSKVAAGIVGYRTENKTNAITVQNLADLALKYKCILIPHGAKQSKDGRDSITNHETFDDILSIVDFIPIMIEDNTKSQREFLELKIKQQISPEKFEWVQSLASISSADRLDFSCITQPTYIWGEPSFDSLFYCAIIGKDRVLRETDIIEKSKYITRVEINNQGGALETSSLSFSHGLNSIIGNSGSGKTLLLNLIKSKLTNSNLKNAISSSEADYSKMYEKTDVRIYDNDNQLVKVGDINVFEGENLYKQIVTTLTFDKDQLLKDLNAMPAFDGTESLISHFNQILNKYITDRITVNKSSSAISESLVKSFASMDYLRNNSSVPGSIEYVIDSKIRTQQQEISGSLQDIENDYSKAKESFSLIDRLLDKYGLKGEIKNLKDIRFKLNKKMLLSRNERRGQQIQVETSLAIKTKISSIVNEFNKSIGQRTKVVNESKQIVSDEIEKIIGKLKEIAILNEQLEIPSLEEAALISSVKKNDEVIKLDHFIINKEIFYEDITDFFDSAIGMGSNKILKSEFSSSKGKNEGLYPINLFDKVSVKKLSEIFVNKGYTNNNIFRLIPSKFIEYEIMIKNLEDEYQPIGSLSAGQLSKIYINLLIDKKLKAMENNAVILYDQPDNNLEKTFILETLGRKLADLKRKYQVIITTHEPLLVVNSDSNNIIRAENDPVAGISKIRYENLTMYDIGNKTAAIEKIAQLIDGSHKAIKKRNQVYGGFDL